MALTSGFGGAEGTRTPDPLHAMQVRYQLRHSPIRCPWATRGILANSGSGNEIGWLGRGAVPGGEP